MAKYSPHQKKKKKTQTSANEYQPAWRSVRLINRNHDRTLSLMVNIRKIFKIRRSSARCRNWLSGGLGGEKMQYVFVNRMMVFDVEVGGYEWMNGFTPTIP